MHLTRFTDLSLRVLIYLTHNERKGLVTVTELAERFKWSRNHMVKVVHFMSTKNWVQTHRGRLIWTPKLGLQNKLQVECGRF